MVDIKPFLEFIQQESRAQDEQYHLNSMLSTRALAELGYSIENLRIVDQQVDTLILQCDKNTSRFRPSDRVFLQSGAQQYKVTILSIEDNGCRMKVKGARSADRKLKWTITDTPFDLSSIIISALNKLQPGAPGWTYVQRIMGEKPIRISHVSDQTAKSFKSLLDQLSTETRHELDASQREVFLNCLAAPSLLGVQGPPGTGKTLTLAFTAEGLARQNKRLVILAPTHQAVNNALSTIHRLFPERKLVKSGGNLRTESLNENIPIISPYKLDKVESGTIIGMTFMSAINQIMVKDRKVVAPNVVIIDEAGQLPLAQGICTGLSGAGSILLFGDDRQMPPIFSAESVDHPLAISIFGQLRKKHPEAIQMLNTTYRLNERLCELIGNTFYSDDNENILRSSEEARDRRLLLELEEDSTTWLVKKVLAPDHSFVWMQVPETSCMQFNPTEGRIAAELVAACIRAGLSSSEIAVVTPFRRQSRYIYNLLEEALGKEQDLPIVDTVERVQGLTVDVIILTLCASEPGYVTSIANFLFSPNRLNVSISRARRKAICISSPDVANVLPLDYQGIIGRNKFREIVAMANSENLPGRPNMIVHDPENVG
jgi:DNA replication ATP-dependent helicase Dna2